MKVLLSAFNKHIANELASNQVPATTTHALALQTMKKEQNTQPASHMLPNKRTLTRIYRVKCPGCGAHIQDTYP
jgi:hypothetical protein